MPSADERLGQCRRQGQATGSVLLCVTKHTRNPFDHELSSVPLLFKPLLASPVASTGLQACRHQRWGDWPCAVRLETINLFTSR